MAGYFDRRAGLWKSAFALALPYGEYVGTGNGRERAAWQRADAAVPSLPGDAAQRVDAGGRILNILCLSGIWCGDCVRSVPILHQAAQAAGNSVTLRILDRDALPEVRDELRVLGAMRVPMAVFLTEDFHEIARYGDRPLAVYRNKAVTELGAACPLPGAADSDALAAETAEWLDLLERVVLMARLAPPLRARHGD